MERISDLSVQEKDSITRELSKGSTTPKITKIVDNITTQSKDTLHLVTVDRRNSFIPRLIIKLNNSVKQDCRSLTVVICQNVACKLQGVPKVAIRALRAVALV